MGLQIKEKELFYFTKMIIKNGKDSKFLEIFKIMMDLSRIPHEKIEINKKIIKVLLDETIYSKIKVIDFIYNQ